MAATNETMEGSARTSGRWLALALAASLPGCASPPPPGPPAAAVALLPAPRRRPVPPGRPAAFRVCVDPGHPGEGSAGQLVVHGLQEARVTWDVANRLKRELEAAGVAVTLTRRAAGEYVDSAERARRARRAGAALMLRLHADAGAGSGFTVYYPRRPGRVLGRVGPSVAVRQASERAGRAFYPALAAALAGQLPGNGLRGDDRSRPGGKRGATAGSILSEVPVLLVEMAFLTNPGDAAWLRRPQNRQRMAAALAQGVLVVRGQGGNRSLPAHFPRSPDRPRLLGGLDQRASHRSGAIP